MLCECECIISFIHSFDKQHNGVTEKYKKKKKKICNTAPTHLITERKTNILFPFLLHKLQILTLIIISVAVQVSA